MNELWRELIRSKHKLLDVGCWNGKRLLELKDKCDVYGMDIDTSKFEGADERIKYHLFEGDITKELETDFKFDFVLLRDVLEHIEKDDLALKNINKVMGEGGYLILSTPKHIPFLNFYDPAWIRWKMFMGEQHKHYQEKELSNLLSNNGFTVKSYHTEGTIKWVFLRWINGFLKYILRSKKQIKSSWDLGHFEWVIVAKKEMEL